MKVTKMVHNEMAAIRRERSAAKSQTKASAAKKTAVRKTTKKATAAKAAPKPPAPRRAPKQADRDPRLPAVGSTLTRQFKGKTIKVKVVEGGFEYEGERFGSISAVARHITGYMISGPVFFKLVEAKSAETK